MPYVQVAKALYDYEAQAEDELNLKEDDSLYILEADDAEWYKAKIRKLDADGQPIEQSEEEAEIGLVPANYVEEAEPMRLSRALYDYEAQNEDELTIAEDELLRVYESDGQWLLVKKQGHDSLGEGGVGNLGFVPANYVDEVEAVDTGDAPEVESQPPQAQASYVPSASTASAGIPRTTSSTAMPAFDKTDGIKMWAVSILDAKKKKKKGTLGIGNGSLFFASESDKTPVQKISVLSISSHAIENKGKQLQIDLDSSAGVEGDAMTFVTDKKDSDEIASKLDESRDKAQRLAEANEQATENGVQEEEEEEETYATPASSNTTAPPPPPPPPPPAASGAILPPPQRTTSSSLLPPPQRRTGATPSPSATPTREVPPTLPSRPSANNVNASRGENCIALYDFEAQGDDELSVGENEALTLVDRENDDWWKVRNASGSEGVVPASYIEVSEGGDASAAAGAGGETEAEKEQREQAEAEAEREQLLAAEQRRKEARDRLAKEAEERRRREALKAQPAPAPPQTTRATATVDSTVRAAREVKIPEGRSAPARPKEASSKAKPAPGKTRVWHDKTGQFRVEAEFLGFNQGKLRLHKLNGVVIEVAIEKMSNPDIEYLEQATGKQLRPSRERRPPQASAGASASSSDPRRADRERERQKEKERERRRREAAGRGPRRNVDWFEFFLAAGVDMHDCTRYATAFEKDNIDEKILPDMEPSVLRSLGLREGDNIRVMKFIEKKYKPQKSTSTPTTGMSQDDISKQMKADEALARKLQEQEGNSRSSDRASPGLFSGPDGSLKNNTRRGRPTPSGSKSGAQDAVDAAYIAAASQSLSRVSSPPTRTSTASPEVDRKRPSTAQSSLAPASSGFDDDAWTPRPSSAKPVSPAPPAAAPAKAPTPPPAKAPTPPPAPAAPEPPKPAADPNSALFDKLAAMKPPSAPEQRPGASPSNPNSFLGGYNGPRGPMAPVPSNQGLLQPLISTQGTGQFVPTRPMGMAGQQTGMGMGPQMTGWGGQQQQQTGYGMGMQGQATGYQQGGFGGGMGSQPTGYGMGGMASQPTGWMEPQQTATMSNVSGFAVSPQPSAPATPSYSSPAPAPQAANGTNGNATNGSASDKYGAGNIFAAMKTGQFAKSETDMNANPQAPQKYDALRPQPTGWSPAGVQQPQQTGFGGGMMGGQMTGYGGGMQPQYTAQPQQPQQTGMMYGQPTGFYGQQQQQPQGQWGYGQQQYR